MGISMEFGIWFYHAQRVITDQMESLPRFLQNANGRLFKRNEYFCSSHHPLRETIMQQTGNVTSKRQSTLQHLYSQAQDILIHTWEPELIKGTEVF